MSGQHVRPHGLFLTQDAERLATEQERSAVLPARRPFRRTLRRLLGGGRRAPRRGAARGQPRYRAQRRAGSAIRLPVTPQLEPLPPVDVDEPPRAIPQVAAMAVSIWLPPVDEQLPEPVDEQLPEPVDEDPVEFVAEDLAELRWSLCPCGQRWGPCLLGEVAEILRHPLVDVDRAVDSIVMAAVR